jgi:hypothetical protein
MPLKKHFLKPSIETIPVKKWRLTLHLTITLALAYSFYLTIVCSYELMKYNYFNFGDQFEINFLHQFMPTSWFLKFGCAFVTLLFSYTFLQKFLFHRPSFHKWHPRLRARRHKVNLFHNGRILNYFFLDIASRLLFTFFVLGHDFGALTFKKSADSFLAIGIMSLIILYFSSMEYNSIVFCKI